MKKPKPGDSNSSSGNQEKLGVPAAMQPWSCEERRSGFRIKKERKKHKTAQLSACGGGKNRHKPLKKKKKQELKSNFKNIYNT